VGEVRHPQPVRPIRLELPVHPVQRARCLGIGHGGAHRFASTRTAQPREPHQPLDGAVRNHQTPAVQLAPDLVGAVDLQVLVVHVLHLRQQLGITPGSRRRAACRRYADGATCSAVQIGSTPKQARCSSMKAFTSCDGGRAPLGRTAGTGPWHRRPCAPHATAPREKTSWTSSSWLHSQSKEPPQEPGRFKMRAPWLLVLETVRHQRLAQVVCQQGFARRRKGTLHAVSPRTDAAARTDGHHIPRLLRINAVCVHQLPGV
jgi:hypothetical protein